MNLVDAASTYADLPGVASSNHRYLTGEGWLTVRPSTTNRVYEEDYVSLSRTDTRSLRLPASDPDMEAFQSDHLLGSQSQVVTPTAQQAIETIHIGEVQWAAACIDERTPT